MAKRFIDGQVLAPEALLEAVGTVSESAGVPTGAIIESGSNANGEYIKYADGTMICHHTSTSSYTTNSAIAGVYYSPSFSFTYPQPFIAEPVVQMAAYNPVNAAVWTAASGVGSTSNTPSFRMISYGNTGSAKPRYVAIGRWY